MIDPLALNEFQETTVAALNDRWGLASWRHGEDGLIHFTADDGDTGWIDEDGDWDWD